MEKRKCFENGQVIVILALAMTGLLAFAALAIDGGMIYADRRVAQNAADASALAGAGAAAVTLDKNGYDYYNFACTGDPQVLPAVAKTEAEKAAISRASNNQFTIDTVLDDGLGVEILCGSVSYGSVTDSYIDTHVLVSAVTRTAFAQLFIPGGMKNTVEAVARARPRTPLEFGLALAALGTTCGTNTGGIDFTGTSDVTVTGGGIYSNSCINKSGASGTVGVIGGNVFARGSLTGHFDQITPTPTSNSTVPPLPRFNVPAPDCASLPDRGSSDGGSLLPGRYSSIDVKSDTTLAAGLYCLTGDLNSSSHNLTGAGVTIYMISGDVKVTGDRVVLQAPTTQATGAGAPLKGMLIYSAYGNTGAVSFTGNTNSIFQGSVYAPDGTIEIGGTVDIPYATQVIGKYVKTHGTANISVNSMYIYEFVRLPQVELEK